MEATKTLEDIITEQALMILSAYAENPGREPGIECARPSQPKRQLRRSRLERTLRSLKCKGW